MCIGWIRGITKPEPLIQLSCGHVGGQEYAHNKMIKIDEK